MIFFDDLLSERNTDSNAPKNVYYIICINHKLKLTQCSNLWHIHKIMELVPYRPMILQYSEILAYYWFLKVKQQFMAH